MPTSATKKLSLPDEETIERLQSDKELVHVLGLLGIDITGRVTGDVKENMKVLNHGRARCYNDLFKIPHIGNDVFTNYTRFDTDQTREAALCIQVAAKFHLANYNDAIVKTLNATFKDVAKCSDFRTREYQGTITRVPLPNYVNTGDPLEWFEWKDGVLSALRQLSTIEILLDEHFAKTHPRMDTTVCGQLCAAIYADKTKSLASHLPPNDEKGSAYQLWQDLLNAMENKLHMANLLKDFQEELRLLVCSSEKEFDIFAITYANCVSRFDYLLRKGKELGVEAALDHGKVNWSKQFLDKITTLPDMSYTSALCLEQNFNVKQCAAHIKAELYKKDVNSGKAPRAKVVKNQGPERQNNGKAASKPKGENNNSNKGLDYNEFYNFLNNGDMSAEDKEKMRKQVSEVRRNATKGSSKKREGKNAVSRQNIKRGKLTKNNGKALTTSNPTGNREDYDLTTADHVSKQCFL